MGRNASNGPTFTAAPYKKPKPITDAQRAIYYRQKDIENAETIEACAKLRELNKLFRTDPRAFVEKLSGKQLPEPAQSVPSISRRP
jgi:hypothetical protein